MFKNIKIVLLFSIFVFSVSTYAETARETENDSKKTLKISEAWARKPLSPNNNSATYMTIENISDKDVTIIGASSVTIANNVELHQSFVDEKGVSRMSAIDNIVVPASSSIDLKPGGMHIMLFDLKKSLSIGDKFPIEIKLKESDSIKIEVEVR